MIQWSFGGPAEGMFCVLDLPTRALTRINENRLVINTFSEIEELSHARHIKCDLSHYSLYVTDEREFDSRNQLPPHTQSAVCRAAGKRYTLLLV